MRNRYKGPKRRQKRLTFDTRKLGIRIGLCIVGLLAIGLVTYLLKERAGLPPGRMPRRIPPYYESAERAKPFPSTLPPSLFKDPKVAQGYAIAQRIPDVLAQQPCFCGCGKSGHRSLLSCFASDHGQRCPVCIKEAYLADRLNREGRSAEYIRRSIIAGEWWSVNLD